MVKVIQDFIENNIDLIDTENWDLLLTKMDQELHNGRIQQCFDVFDEADIETEELYAIRLNRIIESINSNLKSLKPNRYKPNEVIFANSFKWYGFGLEDLIYFIYHNQDFWPDNLEFIDKGYEKDPDNGYYIIVVN